MKRKCIKRMFSEQESVSDCRWIDTRDIRVDPEYRRHRIGKAKFERKMNYWVTYGKFESEIVLDEDYNLIDGYSSLRIAEIYDIERVPVRFV